MKQLTEKNGSMPVIACITIPVMIWYRQYRMKNMNKSVGYRKPWYIRPLSRTLALTLALMLMGSALAEAVQPDANVNGQDASLNSQYDPGLYSQDAVYVEPTINVDAQLRVGYVASPLVEMNPFLCTERDLVSLNQLVFESVIELDEQLKPVPLLADSWVQQDDTWTFTLRSGIVFHNGAPLTAAEVVSSYQRFSNGSEDNPYYSRVALIRSMEAVDELTLQVTFNLSGYAALYAMTFPVVQSGTMSDSMPRGTGPYWYTQYITGVGVRLENNPLWWKKDAQIQSVAALNYASTGDALEALRTKEIDLLCTQSGKAAVNRKLSDLTSMDYMTNTFEMLVPNLDDESSMGSIEMRQVVMYALDRASIAENAYLGMGVQCEVPVNPGNWLYESQSAIYYYSPERALQLLLADGWKDLTGDGLLNKIDGVMLRDLDVNIVTYNEGTSNIRENAAELVAAYLRDVGVNAVVTVYSKERCLNQIRNGNYDLALVSAQLSEIPNLDPLLQSGGKLNLNGFQNGNMENLLKQVHSAATEDELRSLFSQIQMLVVERLPVMGLVFRSGSVLATRSLAGLKGLRAGDTLNGIEFMSP